MEVEEKIKELYKELNGGEIVYFETLREIARGFHPGRVLEVGSGWALSAIAFLLDTEAKLMTVDKQGLDTLVDFKRRIDLFDLWNRIEMVTGDSKEVADKVGKDYDIVFVDGDHTYTGAKADLGIYADKVRKGGLLLVDDVFHYLNWANKEGSTKEPEYGVAKALAEWAIANVPKVEVFANHNGLAKIQR